jgi:hypothetical protein
MLSSRLDLVRLGGILVVVLVRMYPLLDKIHWIVRCTHAVRVHHDNILYLLIYTLGTESSDVPGTTVPIVVVGDNLLFGNVYLLSWAESKSEELAERSPVAIRRCNGIWPAPVSVGFDGTPLAVIIYPFNVY